MWKDYSKSYIRQNRASGASIMAAAFVATMFLSLLCGTAYNFWRYEVEKIVLEEGDWQGRIICEKTDKAEAAEKMDIIRRFANVKEAEINRNLSESGDTVIDIRFANARTIYRDMPQILERLEQGGETAEYHELLLSRYLIYDPKDETPPLLLPLYLAILGIVMLSLVLIIRNSFELSMNARVHQFGILASIGATPGQIKICLLQEAAALSALPILLGSLFGVLLSRGVIGAINVFAADVAGRHEAVFCYSLLVLAFTVLISAFTVLFSAWIPAVKLGRMTPLAAIRNTGGPEPKRRKHARMLSLLFGIEGELAGCALKAQKKSLRISTLSLLLSFLGFSVMLCFTTLADISTTYTYFERYQDAWDVMITVKDTAIAEFSLTEEVQSMPGVRDAALYQKADAVTFLPKEEQSGQLLALGGFGALAGAQETEGGFLVSAPVVILDDASFSRFCAQIGAAPGLDGAVIINQIWDSANSNFRYPAYVPFVREDKKTTTLCPREQTGSVDIPVLAYTQSAPLLREEYEDYALVHVVPLTLWNNIAEQAGEVEPDSYIRILAEKETGLADLDALEGEAAELVSGRYEIQSENRIRERMSNDNLIFGMEAIFGAFCALLAVIGIANVFSNTLGFLRQRKREFARYMSVGLTPREMKKIFCIEAAVIAGRPILVTVPLTVLFVQFAVTASYLDPMVFWERAPVVPVFLFAAAIALFVALAYYIGGKRLLRCNLNETLRDDVLV